MGALADIGASLAETSLGRFASQTWRGLGMRSLTAIERTAPTGGPLVRSLLEEADSAAETSAGPAMAKYRNAITKISDKEWPGTVKYLDTGDASGIVSGEHAANTWQIREVFDEAKREALKRNLMDPSWAVKDYWVRKWEPEIFAGKNRDIAIKNLIRQEAAKGHTVSWSEANSILEHVSKGGQKMYNLEKRRVADIPGYRTDKAAGAEFVQEAYRRFAHVDILGSKDERLHEALSIIRNESGREAHGFAADTASNILRRSVGGGGGAAGWKRNEIVNAVGSVEAVTKLGLAFSNHPTQVLGTAFVTGLGPLIRAAAKAVADHGSAEEFALESGATFYNVLHEIRGEAGRYPGFLNEVSSKALTPLYWLDKWRRVIASEAGRFSAQDEFAKLLRDPGNAEAIRKLNLYRVNWRESLKSGAKQLPEAELREAAKRVSDITQLRSTTANLPIWWRDSALGRTLTLFKQFFYLNSNFIKDYVLKPALPASLGGRGDLKPLLYAAILFPTFGELQADMRAYLRKGEAGLKQRPSWERYPVDRIIDNMASVGAFGIYKDSIDAMSFNNESMIWRFVAGPAISDAVDTWMMGVDAYRSPHPLNKLSDDAKKKLLRSVPVIGPYSYQAKYGRLRQHKPGALERGVATRTVKKIFD